MPPLRRCSASGVKRLYMAHTVSAVYSQQSHTRVHRPWPGEREEQLWQQAAVLLIRVQ